MQVGFSSNHASIAGPLRHSLPSTGLCALAVALLVCAAAVAASPTNADANAAPVITDPGDKSYTQAESITAFAITVTDADGETPTVTVTGLPSGLSYADGQVSGTVAANAAVKDHTVTITAKDESNPNVTETFTITVTDVNFSPAITDPGDKTYAQGEAITAFDITVTDADGETPTVTVTGLPPGLSYASGQVSGTVAANAAAQDHTVTITARDGTNPDVTETFTITVTDVNFAPAITDPGDKSYTQGESITAFGITVTDPDGETPTVTVTGLPSGLSYASGQVSGTVSGSAAAQDHTVTITANDGTNADVTETFTVSVKRWKPAAPSLTRTRFSTPTDPALDVTWSSPPGGLTITGYKAQYRKKAAAGQDPAAWTAYSGTLGATATTFNLAGLDAGATYEAQVRAVTSQEGEGAWSDTGEGTANRAPTLAGTSIVNFSLQWYKFGNHLSVTDISNGFFQDADSDAISYSASSQYPGVMKAWIDGVNLKIQTLNPTGAATTVTYGASDAYGGYVSRTVDVTGTIGTVQASIVENAGGGRYVRQIKGEQYQNTALTYTLTGEAFGTGPFAHDATTGWISLKSGKSLDYETKSTYSGKLAWVVQGQTASVNITINVTDLEAGKPGTPTVTRTEFSEPTDPALDVTWTAPTLTGEPTNPLRITGYEAQYRKKAAEGKDPAAWTAYSGTLGATATTFRLSGLTAGATYEAQVRAIAGVEGPGSWSDTGEGTANRAPAATSASFSGGTFPVGTVATYSETGQGAVGVLFSDADGDALTYSAAAQHPALLGVSLSGAAGSAQLRVTLLNQGSSKVTYTARDAYGGSVTRTTTIGITAKVSRSIAEHSPAGTAVGTPVTGTPYNGAALTYSLAGKASSSGLFVINSATGQISVATGATLDYETDDSDRETEIWNGQVIAKFYRGKVNYTVDGHAAAIDVIIKVTDIGSPKPATPTVTRTTFSEPTDPALDVTWTAPTGGGLTITGYKAQYRKKAAAGQDPAAWTAYSGTLGATATTFNLAGLDAGATYEAQVRAVTSQEGESAWSDTGEGTANRAPTLAGTSIVNFSLQWYKFGNHLSVTDISNGFFQDADSDAISYSASSQYPGVMKAWIDGVNLKIQTLNPTGPRPPSPTGPLTRTAGTYPERWTSPAQSAPYRPVSLRTPAAAGTCVR